MSTGSILRPSVYFLTLVTSAAAGAAPAAARVDIAARPSLRPRFRAGVTDYVSRCARGTPLRLKIDGSAGERVSVARGRPHRGRFIATVRRAVGAQVVIRVQRRHRPVRAYHVRCLPQDFGNWTVRRRRKPQAEWYVVTTGPYVAVFDSHGTPVWWYRSGADPFRPWDAKLLGAGVIAWGKNSYNHFGVRSDGAYELHRLDGRLVRVIRTVGNPIDTHDLQRMPNGHFLAITYRRRDNVDLSAYGGQSHARVFDAEIQELTASGRLVWRWNSHNHISPSETGRYWWYNEKNEQPPPEERGYDLIHANSVEPDGDGLIVSARHLSAVFHIDRRTGDVDWKLGGSFVPGRSLKVLGVPSGEPVFSGQHDARQLPDGTLTVYDNRSHTGRPAADRFRIDPVARTATRIAHVTEPDAPMSDWGGSARRLPGGDWVVCWGGTPLITEETARGALVLSLRLPWGYTYRAQPVPPGLVSAADLRRGMDEMTAARRGGSRAGP